MVAMVTGMYDGSNSYILHTNNQILQIKRTLLLMAWNNGHASRIVCKNASQITKQETKHTFFRQHFWVESLLLCLGGSIFGSDTSAAIAFRLSTGRGFAGPGWGSGTFWGTGSLPASFWAVGSTCHWSCLTVLHRWLAHVDVTSFLGAY